MQYFTEQASSHREVMDKIRLKYGDKAKILTHRTVRIGGVLGFFSKEGVEMTGYVTQDTAPKIRKMDMEEERKKILEGAKSDKGLRQVIDDVRFIKERLETGYPNVEKKHPSIEKIETVLQENEFNFSFIQNISNRLKSTFSLEDMENFQIVSEKVLDWIAESILIKDELDFSTPRVFILVGPTGVGKTTTIAKLAAIYGLGNNGFRPRNVRMITIDSYRIGAWKQIETYANIMGIPVSCVETYEELQKRVTLYKDTDLVLVDTIGKSPKDYLSLAKMRSLLDACGSRSEIALALSATTKVSDVKEILQQFEPFNFSSIVLTKLDETMRIGNIISVLAEKRKPISFITDGQNVPQDIRQASVVRLLKTLEGFNLSPDELERKFGGRRVKNTWMSVANDGLTPEEQIHLQSGNWIKSGLNDEE